MKTPHALVCAVSLLAAVAAAAAPESNPRDSAVTLKDFKLIGDLNGERAAFTLSATVRVDNPNGDSIELLSGPVALTEPGTHPRWRVRADGHRFVLVFDRRGEWPVQLKFHAAVRRVDAWNAIDFRVAPGVAQPIVLRGLKADTQFQFAGAARPERAGDEFVSYLPSDGTVRFSWKETRPEAEGKLFYSAEMLSQISVSPGLMRQVALLDFRIMQGELQRVTLLLRGEGEVTRVQGDAVLAWQVEPVTNSDDRRLVVQLNQPQKEQCSFQVQQQTPLGAFPQTAEVLQLRPENATRFTGCFRIVNDGAVRLEVVRAAGASQISPEQFPESDATRTAFRLTGSQRFAYRFSGADVALRIQADQIQPELAVSELLTYHHGENELAVEAELELDIREAPLRELVLHVPRRYVVARLNAPGLNDYFLREMPDGAPSELRLVYGQPVSGRQLVQLRLEHNQALGDTNWTLPRVEVGKAKSVRGFVGISADPGFRLTPQRTQALTEMATAFFPRKITGIHAAFRLSDAAWQATVRVERLPQTVQADGFHLFSIGEGVAYGSSLLNYVISGAPLSLFRVELSEDHFNVEFTGKDIRGWQKTDGGYLVQLHTPVSGPYTLLATYERPFNARGETLAFAGARALDARTEQGHTLIISAYQFQVKPVEISPGLLPLEPGEVPPEYRLFFDAPILAAYRYAASPFNLKLALSPLVQGDSVSQIVDRGALTTRISREGQVLTEAHYFIKNRGHPHFRLTLPEGTQLWTATVDGKAVVPVMDGKDTLIPLPQRADPNAVLQLDLKLAAQSRDPGYVSVAAPTVSQPVMLAEWRLEPDAGQRLVYRQGSLTPAGGLPEVSGFAQLARTFTGSESGRAILSICIILGFVAAGLVLWRWATGDAVQRYSARHVAGAALGLVALGLAAGAFAQLRHVAGHHERFIPGEITLLAPVQQAGSTMSIEVSNLRNTITLLRVMGWGWPALFALAVWAWAWRAQQQWLKPAGMVFGWTLLAWAALRFPNGATAFFWIVLIFLFRHVVAPGLSRLWQLPRRPETAPAASVGGTAPAAVAVLLAAFLFPACGSAAPSRGAELDSTRALNSSLQSIPESVIQHLRVEDRFVLATARISWRAEKGQELPVLFEHAVLTRVVYPTRSVKLAPAPPGSRYSQVLVAQKEGRFDVEVHYQLEVARTNAGAGFTLPVPFGLVNRVNLEVVNLDVDVSSPQAVSVERQYVGTNTIAALVLPPGQARIAWKPRRRDVRLEKPVFYAEIAQLYVPAAGVVEGSHHAMIRPAQGELSELIFTVPPGATVSDVIDPAKSAKNGASLVTLWRFDPDTRKLRVTLHPAQSRPFALVLRSQLAASPLPFERAVGLVTVEGAAGQVGLLGVATGNEVQLDAVNAEAFSPINLEDFPGDAAAALGAEIPGLTVRRAYRYSDPRAAASLKASPVEPDVRVETQDTLSLGEDRSLLAVKATVDITRAGVFRLSFIMPEKLEVEAISGPALSHWTELRTDAGRVITLHLAGKTEGRQSFAISLAGPGVRATNGWVVPQVALREAGKQRGTLLLVPEQGLRLQVATREGFTQLDPQKSGIREKGVLAFRVLQTPSRLALDIERVDPWIQVTSLQHATLSEAQVRIAASLQYQIENTGLKALHVLIPTNAEAVRFQGEQVADFLAVPDAVTNGLQEWEIKLHRRIIGPYLLRVTWQTALPGPAPAIVLRGVQATGVDLQRGFVTVQSDARLQMTIDALPAALQPVEWQSIPRALQQDLPAAAANFAYRLVEPSFQCPIRLERHEAARLLPARVDSLTLNSVIADDGVMLTQVRLGIFPGDKRLLRLELPREARFWFAFVNDNGVWPWRDEAGVLVPLEEPSHGEKPVLVEIYYSCRAGTARARALDLELLAPKFDLPLENILWRVSLSDKWKVGRWTGTFQLQRQEIVLRPAAVDLRGYLQNEGALRLERTREAGEFLALGNRALEKGDPQEARRAFEAAYGLSAHDAAFNEDARVQLHNIKLQQALVGLNVRQSAAAGDSGALAGKFRELRGRKELNYTQQDARDIIDRNTVDENSAWVRLAERLIQQQDAAASSPAAIRANIPVQGRILTFNRAVVVDPRADLRIGLRASASMIAPGRTRILILAGTFLLLAGMAMAARSVRPTAPGRGITG